MTRTVALYAVTALAELLGCWLVWRWLKQDASAWWLIPAAASLASFAWLLTLHDAPSGRVFAAYGAVYVVMAVGWLWWVDGIRPTGWDVLGSAVVLAGMAVIALQPQR
jgi:small multidrug resistance family-3 protein